MACVRTPIFYFLEVSMKHTRFFVRPFVLLLCTVLLALFCLSSCQKEPPLVVKDSDTCIVIRTTEASISQPDMLLLEYMEQLREDGKLIFDTKDGMVISINGIENAADYSEVWMLYTSDEEQSNSIWGTVEYDGNVYGSAVLGAETLKIKPNCLYIWVYKPF